MEPITDLHVQRAQEAAHRADEISDAAGLLFAEAVVTGIGDIGQLLVEFKAARASANFRWSVLADAVDQADRDRQVPA